jgi:iron complex transport system substrate-binding protein
MNPPSLTGVTHNLDQLGIIFGTEAKAEALIVNISERQARVKTALGIRTGGVRGGEDGSVAGVGVRTFVQISKEPLFTIGKQSFVNEILISAGGSSVTADVESAYPKLSKETATALQPEVIILSASEDNQVPNEAFKNSPAVKNGRVYKINADILSRPGPRLVDALEQIAKMLHPEKFN